MSINPETPESMTLEIAAAQVKRSAPPHPPWRVSGPDPDEEAAQILPHRTFLRFCGCSAAFVLMADMRFLILLFTAFRIKDPHIIVAGLTTTGPHVNI
ncbi:unnamed protein product [Linum trigynum]|uniref:Uncharacterized protein n=1 Tax=Linum trigynum TaxID=586398 RepID=A0AAV2D805_9ROSI